MGPWYDPYRDGPDPALIERKRFILKVESLRMFAEVLKKSFGTLGEVAHLAGLAMKGVTQ